MTAQPTLFMTRNLLRQSIFLSNIPQLAVAAVWRGTVVFQYLALFLLPLAPIIVNAARKRAFSLTCAAVMGWGTGYGLLVKGRLMPSLGYNLSAVANRVSGLPLVLTCLSTIVATALASLVVRHYGR